MGGHGGLQVLPGVMRPLCCAPTVPRDRPTTAYPGAALQSPCPLGLQGPTSQPLPGSPR